MPIQSEPNGLPKNALKSIIQGLARAKQEHVLWNSHTPKIDALIAKYKLKLEKLDISEQIVLPESPESPVAVALVLEPSQTQITVEKNPDGDK